MSEDKSFGAAKVLAHKRSDLRVINILYFLFVTVKVLGAECSRLLSKAEGIDVKCQILPSTTSHGLIDLLVGVAVHLPLVAYLFLRTLRSHKQVWALTTTIVIVVKAGLDIFTHNFYF